MRRSLFLKQDPPSGDWALALHRKSHDGCWLECRQARVVTRRGMLPFLYHCNPTNMQVCLNQSRHPSADAATAFVKEQYVGVYKSFYDFASRYYGIDNLLAGSQVNPAAYKALYPIHVFDVSKQSERLTEVVVDFTVKMEFSENVPADTQAYALVISDRMLKFKSDGSMMSVLF